MYFGRKKTLEQSLLLTPKNKLGYIEEYLVITEYDLLLKYSLSNSLDEIEISIFERTGQSINLKTVFWEINTRLVTSVKHLMNKHHVRYSMTTWKGAKNRKLVVNMRANDLWFYTGFSEIKGKFYSWDKLQTYEIIMNAFRRISNATDNDD